MRGKRFSSGALLDNKNNKKPGMPQSLRCSNGEHHMADQTPRYRSYDNEVDTRDKSLIDRRVAPYKFGQSARTDSHAEDPVPLFLSDYDGEPDPSEYMTPLRKDRRFSVSSRILAGVLATAAVAILFAMFSSDATRDIIVNAKASIAASLPAPYAAAQRDPAQLTARDTQLKNPNDAARLSAPASQTPGIRSVSTVAVAPTREEITTAYQSALQGRAPAAAAPAAAAPLATPPVAAPPVAASPARRLDADELAALMKRAKGMIAIGDIAAARLLLERAADAQEASAALLLAQTYDPAVLGAQDTRSITPDPAAARTWYQKAAQLGSPDASQRLAQMQK
jgi:TPR repeat protein